MKASLISSALVAATLLTAPSLAFAQATTRDTSENAQRPYARSQDSYTQRERAAARQQRRNTAQGNQSMEDWSVHYNEQHIFGN